MKQEQLDAFADWFDRYIQAFFSTDGDNYLNNNLQLKKCHTRRVCELTRQLAAELGLDPSQACIAEAIALFHDVGRFEQFKKYRTYKDHTSENHARMGLRILEQTQILACLEPQDRQWILKAIDYHNMKALPEGLDDTTALFSKLIRDADKLDIFYLAIDSFRQYRQNPCTAKLEIEFPDEPSYSAEILRAVENGTLIDYRLLRTLNDVKLLQIGWVYDIYFDASLNILVHRKVIEQIAELLPHTPDIQRALDAVAAYIKSRLKCSLK